MDISHLKALAQEAMQESGFLAEKEIYAGGYYNSDKARDLIYSGLYKSKKSVLKVYDDPRVTYEPENLEYFLKVNRSNILLAPQLYASKIISPHRGWLIIEYLEGEDIFRSPLTPDQKEEFLNLFLEYRKIFPLVSPQPLSLIEKLPPAEFTVFRLNRWLEVAHAREPEEGEDRSSSSLIAEEFLPRYLKGLKLIRSVYESRKMVWCHGHFKPKEIFRPDPDGPFYLTDFAHSNLFPEGYEFAFIIWADSMMDNDWSMAYEPWRQAIEDWLVHMRPLAETLDIKDFDILIRAALAERCLGTLLANVAAAPNPPEEKRQRIANLYHFLDELLR